MQHILGYILDICHESAQVGPLVMCFHPIYRLLWYPWLNENHDVGEIGQIRSIERATYLHITLRYMLEGKKNDTNRDFWEINSKYSHPKVHNYLLVKVILKKFFNLFFEL
jgi:hypothetical protein